MSLHRFFTFTVLLSFFIHVAGAANYYVSPRGDDSGPGSFEKPWKTVDRVNQVDLQPGDQVFFEGGSSYAGALRLAEEDSGSEALQIIVSSYGIGRATLDGGHGSALLAEGVAHLLITGINFVGSGRKSGNTESGVVIDRSRDVFVDSIDVSGFQSSGVLIRGSKNIRLTRVYAFENGFSGISSNGPTSEDLYVGYSLTENNPGDPTILTNHSGNGIVLGRVKRAVIEYCEARYNGWDMPRKGNGPVGIWIHNADQSVIQYCVSHHNRSTGIDGGGFDFDGGVTNSVLQYNYSHDNHGSGYLICQYYGAPPFRDNIVRYNISQDDGLTNHDAGIYVWVGGSGMESTDCYNNTIYNSKGSAVAFGADRRFLDQLPRMTFRNNIFVSGEDQIAGGAERGRFEGNLYWSMGDGGFLVDGFTSFEEWVAATGQEKIGDKVVGMYVDPGLRKDGTGLITDPADLQKLTPYQLIPTSPAIDRGVDLPSLYQIDMGGRDFFGNPLPQGDGLDIGAHEYRRSAVPLR